MSNPVIAMLGRRLRLALIGGGVGAFIGPIHRQAAMLDNRYTLVAGVFSSNPERSRFSGRELGFPPDRVYGSGHELIEREKAHPEGADVIAIMTPNDSHFALAGEAIAQGFDVICDKPMTNTVEQAESLHALVKASGRIFLLTHNYSGYPMVRQARSMIEAGELGTIRLVQIEYVQGGKARPHDPAAPRGWRFDPARSGPSLVMGDIGTHAHHMLRFVTGLEVDEVAAEVGTIVPGRSIHDYANAMLRLSNGARGNYWVTQAASGVENCLRFRISGNLGTLEWVQETPQILSFKPLDGPAQIRTPYGPGTYPLAARSSRIVRGHPEGFPDAFANLYSDAAEAIAARRAGVAADPLALNFPTSRDGLLGVRFADAVVRSSAAGGAWTRLDNNVI